MPAAASDAAATPASSWEDKVRVKRTQLAKATKALTDIVQKRSANANPLFGNNSEMLVVCFSLSRIPDAKKLKPKIIDLPHPLYDENSDVCIFVKDPQKKYKEIFAANPVPGVGDVKVMGVNKLRKNHHTFDAKRTLADAYDLFLCDRRVMDMMHGLLGKTFYEKKKKAPIPIKINVEDPTTGVLKAVRGTTLRVPEGPSIGVRIGRCALGVDALVENALVVIKAVGSHFGSSNPLQSISIKATDTLALPIWRRADAAAALQKERKADLPGNLSSDASETGSSHAISASELSASELSAMSASEASAADESDSDEPVAREELPLVKGLAQKRKAVARGAAAKAGSAKRVKR